MYICYSLLFLNQNQTQIERLLLDHHTFVEQKNMLGDIIFGLKKNREQLTIAKSNIRFSFKKNDNCNE